MFRKLALIALFGLAPLSFADQHAYLEKSKAEEVSQLLTVGTELIVYCRPCGETLYQKVTIAETQVRYTGSDAYYEVVVNGSGIDLAYVYVFHESRWINLAKLAKLETVEVAAYLDLPEHPQDSGSIVNHEIFDTAPSLPGQATSEQP